MIIVNSSPRKNNTRTVMVFVTHICLRIRTNNNGNKQQMAYLKERASEYNYLI